MPDTPFTLGVFSNMPWPRGFCVEAGTPMVYSVPDGEWIKNVVNFFGGSGSCTKIDGRNFPYMKCC